MIILGVDPGYAILGYGVIEAEGTKVRPVDYGIIETKAGQPFPERLEKLYLGMRQLINLTATQCRIPEADLALIMGENADRLFFQAP